MSGHKKTAKSHVAFRGFVFVMNVGVLNSFAPWVHSSWELPWRDRLPEAC